jgi:hypothetical protein
MELPGLGKVEFKELEQIGDQAATVGTLAANWQQVLVPRCRVALAADDRQPVAGGRDRDADRRFSQPSRQM